MSSRSLSQDEKQKAFELYDMLKRKPGFPIPISLSLSQKFLLARKGDVLRAIELAETYAVTYGRARLNDISPEKEAVVYRQATSGKFLLPNSYCRDGAGLFIFVGKEHHYAKHEIESNVRASVFLLSCLTDNIQVQRKGVTIVFDLAGVGSYTLDYSLIKRMMELLQSGFPGRLHKAIILHCPFWARKILKLVMTRLKSKLKQRILVTDNWQDHISPGSFPKDLGGDLAFSKPQQTALLDGLISTKQRQRVGNRRRPIANQHADQSMDPISSGFVTVRQQQQRGRKPRRQVVNADMFRDQGTPSQTGRRLSAAPSTGVILSRRTPTTAPNPPPSSTPVSKQVVQARRASVIGPPQPQDKWREERSNPFSDQNMRQRVQSQPTVDMPAKPKSHSIKLENLNDYVQKLRDEPWMVMELFSGLQEETYPTDFTHALHPANRGKNRYKNVLSFDRTRFILPGPHDYINANYVDGVTQKKSYIACQAPLPHTVKDFWLMIWSSRTSIIVMLTQEIENGRTKSCRYWPSNQSQPFTYDDVEVTLQKEYHIKGRIERQFDIKHIPSQAVRKVTQIQLVAWPDHGVPDDPRDFLSLRQSVLQLQALDSAPAPIIVHCSAGIGRTGTYIAVDICATILQKHKKVDVYRVVKMMRNQRYGVVQTPEQYQFIHEALAEILDA